MLATTGMRTAIMALSVAMAVSVTMTLAGCVASEPVPTDQGQDGTSSPRPTPTGAATAIPVAPSAQQKYDAVTQIIVRPEMLELKDQSGADVATLSYDATADEFVEVFTALLGAAPTVTESPWRIESLPETRYVWEGFRLADDHESGDYQADMNVSVTFSAPELGPRGITVSTIQGFKPGDDLRWLATYMDEPFSEESEFHQIQAERGPPIGEQNEYSEYSNSNSVTGQTGYPDKTSVIFAPWNFGIGHV